MHSDKARDILRGLNALTPKQRDTWEVATTKLFKKKIAELLKHADEIAAIKRQTG